MTRPFKEWTVLPHGKVVEIDAGVLGVVGEIQMPIGKLPRRMTIVRLRDGRLVIYNAIALDTGEMEALEQYGRPAFQVIPGDHHRLDARIWASRYPDSKTIAPAGARSKVEEVIPVDEITPDFDDPDVVFVTVPGTRGHECALLVTRPSGTTLVLNDLIANIRGASGFTGWMLKLMGFAGEEPQIPRVAKAALIDDKEALRQQLLQWSQLHTLKRIIVSHGDIIEDDPRGALQALAQTLGETARS